MRKKWLEPKVQVQEFTPNEYVAACYHGVCDISGYVFNDTNGNGEYDLGVDRYNYYNTACAQDYWIEGQDAQLPNKNAFVFQDREWVSDPKWDDWFNGYYVGVGEPVPAWNFDRVHTTTQMDLENRPNHS